MKQQYQIIIDSHVHLDHINRENHERIAWMKERRYIPVSWAFAEHIKSLSHLKEYLKNQKDFINQMNDTGLKSFFLSGVHPRNIPDDLKPGHIKEIIMPFLDDPFCLGIGEIGLETGSQKEKEIFAAHLEMGNDILQIDKCIGIHTPRDNKQEITIRMLEILYEYPGIENVAVIDHCSMDILDMVLTKGFWAGITLSTVKSSFKELSDIIDKFPDRLGKIMCNSDSGTIFHQDFFDFFNSKDFPSHVRQKLACDNAAEFFKMIV